MRAAVIGAGAIGAGTGEPDVKSPSSHAAAYMAAGFKLVALADSDAQARRRAERWGCPVYANFDEMMNGAKPEVLSFAVPTDARPALLLQALAFRPLAVIAEKPLAPSVTEAKQIVAAYRDASVPLIVNYTRRFVPAWQGLRGTSAMSTTIRYAKGLRHNGTHAIDLCRMLFGECGGGMPLARKYDYWSDDPTVSALLRFERCPEVYLVSLDERCFTLFEADIIGAASRVIVDCDGTRLRRFELHDHAGTPPGKRLIETAAEDTGAALALVNLMRHVLDVVGGAAPLCTGEDAVAALRIAEEIAAA